jgi:hypothetical protein
MFRPPPVTPGNVWNCGNDGNPVLEPGIPALNVIHTLEKTFYYIFLT